MPLNFPSSPTNGQIYTSGNEAWQYNSTLGKWLAYNSSAPILATTPPTNDDGTLWYDTETGLMFIRYGGAWVEPAGYGLPAGILRTGDIGVTVQAYDATVYTTSDIGGTLAYPFTQQGLQTLAPRTVIDFTGIPSWATCIELFYDQASTNGSSNMLFQIGDSGGIETSGYLGSAMGMYGASSPTLNETTGMAVRGQAAANTNLGYAKWVLMDAATFLWAGAHYGAQYQSGGGSIHAGCSKSLSAALDRARFTITNGTDLFDAGSVTLRYS